MESNQGLKKQISTFEAMSMVFGVVIGSGIFFKASGIFAVAGTPLLGILTWIIAGFITTAAALTVAEIAVAFPKTGGMFIYLKELFGERWAFAYGWIQTFVQVPAVCAALFLMFSTSLTSFVALSGFQVKLVAFATLVFVTITNLLSTKTGSRLQAAVSVIKMLPIVFIIFFGIIKGNAPIQWNVAIPEASGFSFAGFGTAILGALWAYEGWQGVANMSGELKNPARSLPRAIVFGMFTIIATYTLVNLAMIMVLPVEQIVQSQMPASDVARELFGASGATLISVGIAISVFGAANGYFLVGTRMPFAMAQDKLFIFPSFFAQVNQKLVTPLHAIVFQAVICTFYIFSGSFEMLSNMVVFVIWVFSTLAIAGIFVLRKKYKHLKLSYRVPLYPIVPIIGMVGGGYIIVSSLLNDTKNALYGVFMTLIAFPIYNWIKKKQTS